MVKQLSYPKLSQQDLCPNMPNPMRRSTRQTLPHGAQNIHIKLHSRRRKDVGGWRSENNRSSVKKKKSQLVTCFLVTGKSNFYALKEARFQETIRISAGFFFPFKRWQHGRKSEGS